MNGPLDHAETTLDAALDLLPAERQAYLDKACGGDVALRQTVEALLRAHQHARAPREPTLRVSPTVSEQPGDIIGPYKLLQRIGEGGCGVVYMAEQEEPVRRRVALKVIKLGMDTKQVIARFEAERQALALMDHPNIAKVLEAGASDTGRPYFVMELVRGTKITEYCDQNNLPTQQRLELFMQVCKAVQHAHQKGIIHRDIKPSNILVTLHDGVPVPKVIDFGIAKAVGQNLSDKTVFTAFEQFIGTPAYMSPEQAEMSGLDIDTRSDIYSLGVLLYELLTSRIPFDAKDLAVAGLDEMRRIIREKDPVRPSTKLSTLTAAEQTTIARQRQVEAPKLVNLVRGDLDWIVMRCLEKDRTRRYETANGLARDVERHLDDEPVVARPPSRTYRFQKMVRRNKLAFATGGAVGATLVIGLTVVVWLWQKAQTEAVRSAQVAQFLKAMLDEVGPSKAKGRDTTMLRELLDKTAARVGKELSNQPEVQADLQSTIGNVYAELGEGKEAETMHRTALETRRKLFGQEHQEVALSLNNLSGALYANGDQAGSEATAQEALAMQRKLLPRDHPDIAASLNNLATARWQKGELSKAAALQSEAVAIVTKTSGPEDVKVAALLDNLGTMLRDEGKLEEAEDAHRRSLAILRKVAGDQDLNTVSALRNLATVLRFEDKLEEAEARQLEALDLYRKLGLVKHPDVAVALNDLANILLVQDKLLEAETNFFASLAISREISDNLNVAITLDNLGALLQRQQRFAQAEAMHQEALSVFKRQLGDESPDVLGALNNLAAALQRQGKLVEAERTVSEALAVREKRWPNDWKTFRDQRRLGGILLDQKRYDEAEPLLKSSYEGLKLQEATLIPQARSSLTNSGQIIIKLYEAWGKPGQAAEWRAKLGLPATGETTPK